MKKLIAIFFLALFALQAPYFSELLKADQILKHYKIHRQQEATVSFIQFISIHYFKGDVKDKDYDQDMKLPFKHLLQTNNQIVLATNILPAIKVQPLFYSDITKQKTRYLHTFTEHIARGIWQPPKTLV